MTPGPSDANVFRAFSVEHLAALAAIVALGTLMVVLARRRAQPWQRGFEVVLAVLLLVQWPLSYWLASSTGVLTVENSYPCHFCDFGAFVGIAALLTHRRFLVEWVYFWGLAGTLQGLITPALTLNWPHPRFMLFFLIHGGVVIAALYGVLGLRIIPRARAKWIAFLLMLAYAVVVGLFDYLVGANYGFLRHKPETASLFDLLGPWPWYIGVTTLLGLVLFTLLDLPFIPARRREKREISLQGGVPRV